MALAKKKKAVIGWSELVDFPDWNIAGLSAKVDTGARSCALHVENLKVLSGDRVRFDVVLDGDHEEHSLRVVAPVIRWARVRSSTGEYKKRCFVRARMRLASIEKEVEISLVSREKMLYRFLLGRRALASDFLVDVSKRHILTPRKTNAARRKKT